MVQLKLKSTVKVLAPQSASAVPRQVQKPGNNSRRRFGTKRVLVTGNTLKPETTSIYWKLGISSRCQAVLWSRDLGFLDH
jgi:hypothetical protein